MDSQLEEKDLSDDEIFFGKMTLKEVKKHLMLDRYRQSLPCTETKAEDSDSSLKIIEAVSEPELMSGVSLEDSHFSCVSSEDKTTNSWDITTDNKSFLKIEKIVSNLLSVENEQKDRCSETKAEDSDSSLKFIEAYSEPKLLSLEDSCFSYLSQENKTLNSWDITTENKSFLENEEMVSNILSIENKEKELLDRLEYISDYAPETEESQEVKSNTESSESSESSNNKINIEETKDHSEFTNLPQIIPPELNNGILNACSINKETIVEVKSEINYGLSLNANENIRIADPSTPRRQMDIDVFKTPKSTVSLKSQLKTPRSTSKLNTYQHVMSPVAAYIKNGPQAQLIKDVKPKKPLSNISLIPKPLQSSNSEIKTNKENINIPSVAYKSAKSVKVIKLPGEKKLPGNQWTKDKAICKPTVIRHHHRENNAGKGRLVPQAEDSFNDLSLHQADLSVCIEKTAYK